MPIKVRITIQFRLIPLTYPFSSANAVHRQHDASASDGFPPQTSNDMHEGLPNTNTRRRDLGQSVLLRYICISRIRAYTLSQD